MKRRFHDQKRSARGKVWKTRCKIFQGEGSLQIVKTQSDMHVPRKQALISSAYRKGSVSTSSPRAVVAARISGEQR